MTAALPMSYWPGGRGRVLGFARRRGTVLWVGVMKHKKDGWWAWDDETRAWYSVVPTHWAAMPAFYGSTRRSARE